MSFAVSVIEVRNALRCPRVFALGRAQRRAVGFPISASSLGAAFHRIVAAFAARARTPAGALAALDPGADPASVAGALAGLLLDEAAAEIERNPRYASMPAEVDDLAEALRELAQHLARELAAAGGPPAEVLARSLEASELELERALELADGELALLGGRLDALVRRSPGSLDVVEYKLAPDANEPLDRAQVALYRWLVRALHEGEAEPALLRFQPKLALTRLALDEGDALVRERLVPLVREMASWAGDGASAPGPEQVDLCPSCPVRAACVVTYPAYLPSRDQPPASAARPLPDAKGEALLPPSPTKPTASHADDHPGREEAEQLREAVERSYGVQGVGVSAGEVKVGPRIVSLEVRAQRGPVREVDRSADPVLQQLEAELGVRASYVKSAGLRRFELARRTPRAVLLAAVLDRAEPYLRNKPGRFAVGEDIDGAVVQGDLCEPAACHLLVGGSSGSGKSVLLRTLIASLAHYHGPEAIRFSLVDTTRASFAPFRASLGAHLAHPLCFEPGQAVEILEGLVHEMEERYGAFERAGVEDLDAFNEAADAGLRIARHVVVVDEFADLLATKALRESFLSSVQRLCAKARAAGIHLVLATQRPDPKTVPGVIKANLVGRIALRVADGAASRILLGQLGAERLLGKGDLYVDFGAGPVRAQAAMVGAGS